MKYVSYFQPLRPAAKGLLTALTLSLTLTMGSDARSAHFEEVGEALGVADLGNGVVALATGFIDIDQDGALEAYFYSEKAIHYVDHNAGELTLVEATHDMPGDFVPEPTSTSVPIDVDNDGTPELMILGEGVHIYRVASPGHLELMRSNPRVFPGSRRVSDAAAGDFNADGLPDVAVAMLRAGEASALQPGAPDMILMNRGGTFEAVNLEPLAYAMTQALTLADMDLDGRVDIIESVNYSGVTGAARILLNRTEAGEAIPVFEVSPHTFDKESFGMGSAVEDVNGDGYLDVFNTSVGRDYMMMGQADGSFVDETSSLGFLHEWGRNSLRVQWSPSFADVDGDGDVDLFVRHGHLGEFQLFGIGTDVAEYNLLYLQDDDGRFRRADVPFNEFALVGGVDAAIGDVNGDGLPDLAMGNSLGAWFGSGGGNMLLPVDAFLWLNASEPAGQNHGVSLHLVPTISAHPPTGARIQATCDGVTHQRQFTHGGKLGAGIPAQMFIGWKTCSSAAKITVNWPSGAISTHALVAGAHEGTLQEPEWWSLSQGEDEAWSLTLDVTKSGGSKVCYGKKAALDTCCTNEQGVCNFTYAPGIKDRVLVQIEDRQAQELPNLVGRYAVTTKPHIPRPGQPFDLIVDWTGLAGTFDADAPWIRIDGAKIPWTSVDEDAKRFVATVESPSDVESLAVQMLHKTKTLVQKDVLIGYNFDPALIDATGFPTEHGELETLWQLTLALSPDVKKDNYAPEAITVRDMQGKEIPSNPSLVSNSRVNLFLSWLKVPEGSVVNVFDGERKIAGPLPALRAPTSDETLILTDSIRGFLVRTSVVEGGDTNRVFFTLVDAQGYPLPPQPDILRAEVDGAEIIDGPMVLAKRPWEITVGLRSTPGVGEVVVRIYDINDRLLGEWDYMKRTSENLPCDLELSDGELGHASIPAGVGATTTAKLRPRNKYGEMLGMDAQMEIKLPSYLEADPLAISVGGFYETTIRSGDYGGEATIEILCNGELAFTLPLEVVGPPPPEPVEPEPVEESDSDVTSQDTQEPEADTGTPPASSDGGCQSSIPSSSGPYLLLALLALGLLIRKRRWLL